MIKQISKFLLKAAGWKSAGEIINVPKCIIVGAPHTSSWDFVVSWLFYTSLGGKANVLIKKEFFFWPLGRVLKKMGGIPTDRSKGANVIRQAVKQFNEREYMQLAITPEGTRKPVKNWKAGFHTIARSASVPVYVVSFDWGRKIVTLYGEFEITANAAEDIKRLKAFYKEKGVKGRNPDGFLCD
ncbi:MAG: acyltransferase [Bacteroidales bacterium]|nr:acyltransferase [Bacteroidales bacterium]